ncbi:Hypp5080 [Branchiostoma lanceolatum]|nr:Hypp5080 [Branchiostoma lanceolatum]
MKLPVCVLFLGCLVLAAAFPAPREEELDGLLTELRDVVASLAELQLQEAGMQMEKRIDQAKYDACYKHCINIGGRASKCRTDCRRRFATEKNTAE